MRVLIVDEMPVAREGLALRISQEPDMEVCAEVTDPAKTLDLIASQSPDVVVVDLFLKSRDAIDLIRRIKTHGPSVRILAWSMSNDGLDAERALSAGALGYISKSQVTDKIIQAIRSVNAGRMSLSPALAEKLLKRAAGGAHMTSEGLLIDSLSDRELQVFRLLGQGLNAREIAQQIHLSSKTVETYKGRIRKKLGLSSSTELTRYSMRWVLANSGLG